MQEQRGNNLKASTIVKKKLYYGWIIVIVAALVGLSETVYFGPVIGSFIKPITTEFNWTRSEFVGALSLGSLMGGLTAAFVGPLVDKHGARWIVFVGTLVLGGTLVAASRVNSLFTFYMAIAGGSICFNGCIGIALSTMVPKWFVKKRGKALAIMNLGIRIGVSVNPYVANTLISEYGWRTAMATMGVMVWAVAVIPAAVFLRRKPEDMGLLPDGEDPIPNKDGQFKSTEKLERSFTLREAVRSKSFYFLVAALSLVFLASTGILFNMVPILTDQGLSSSSASLIILTWSTLGILGTVTSGFLADRISVRHVASGAFVIMGVGIFLMSQINGLVIAYAFAIVHGIVWGAWNNLQILLVANHFGRESLGSIRGVIQPVQTVVSAAGPIAAASAFDITGSYDIVLITYSFLLATAGVLVLAMGSSKPPD